MWGQISLSGTGGEENSLEKLWWSSLLSGLSQLWNGLPFDLREYEGPETFKSKLKTFLFKKTFDL